MLTEIWRYPVKSCGGESLTEAAVRSTGLELDRGWAVVDAETGLVASAKRPALWAALLSLHGSVIDDAPQLRFPDGESIPVDAGNSVAERLSSYIGRTVLLQPAAEVEAPTLERTDPNVDTLLDSGAFEVGAVATGALAASAPAGTVFDFAPIHLITTATLAAIEDAGEPTAGAQRRFRPNLVIDVDGPPFQENDWPGKRIEIGPDLVLDVVWQTPRCAIPTLAQGELPSSVSTLQALATLNRIELEGRGPAPCAGAYATVQQAGIVTVGDGVEVFDE